jgi:hypothetical protein
LRANRDREGTVNREREGTVPEPHDSVERALLPQHGQQVLARAVPPFRLPLVLAIVTVLLEGRGNI